LQLFVGLGKLSFPFRDPALDFICNPLLLIQAQCLTVSRTQDHALILDAVIQALAPTFIAVTVERVSHRSLKFGLLVWDGQIEFPWDGLVGTVD
jgi:hypothetical protein